MTVDEVERHATELRDFARGYTDETAAEWADDALHWLRIHEASHAVVLYSTGGTVHHVTCGPLLDRNLKEVDFLGVVSIDKPPADMLPVYVAGEVGQSVHERRKFDFRSSACRGDRQSVQAVLNERCGAPIEIEKSNLFWLAVERAQEILAENWLVVTTLAMKLGREPFRLDGDQFERFMVRMNVHKI